MDYNIKQKIVIVSFFVFSILFIISFTIIPKHSTGQGGINLIPFFTINKMLSHFNLQKAFINIVGNILLFIPFGFMLPLMFQKLNHLFHAIVIGFFLSFFIECIQIFLSHRMTDIDDVTLNTIGTGIGYGIICFLVKVKNSFRA